MQSLRKTIQRDVSPTWRMDAVDVLVVVVVVAMMALIVLL
jgi:hypothetical protein